MYGRFCRVIERFVLTQSRVTRALGTTQVSAVEIVERAEGEVILGRTYDQAYASTQEMVTVSRFPK